MFGDFNLTLNVVKIAPVTMGSLSWTQYMKASANLKFVYLICCSNKYRIGETKYGAVPLQSSHKKHTL